MFKPAAIMIAAILAVPLSAVLTPEWVVGQVRIQDVPPVPDFPDFQRDLSTIMEMHVHSGSSRSISMTVENGIKKINARDDELKAYIEEYPDGGVLIKVTRQFTSDDLDQLMDEEPELYMHLKSIPAKTDTAEVEVSVDVTRTFEAESLEELESDHPDAFEVYQRFTSGNGADLQRLREFPGFMAPEIRPGLRLDINPGDIRVFPKNRENAPGSDDKDT